MRLSAFCFILFSSLISICSCNNSGDSEKAQDTSSQVTAKPPKESLNGDFDCIPIAKPSIIKFEGDTSAGLAAAFNIDSQKIQLNWVASRMASYFSEVYEMGIKYTPPCLNAASGYWRNALADPHFNKYGEYPKGTEPKLSGNALKLFWCFLKFHDLHHAAFKLNSNYGPATPIDRMKIEKNTIIAAGRAVANGLIMYYTKSTNPKLAKKLQEDLLALANRVSADRCENGTHANGHIPGTVAGAARDTKVFSQSILAELNPQDPENKKYERQLQLVLFGMFEALRHEMPNHEFKPWLTADWQNAYSSLFRTALEAVNQIKRQNN